MDLKQVGWGDMNVIGVAQDKDRFWGAFECGNEPSVSIKCGEFLDWLRNG